MHDQFRLSLPGLLVVMVGLIISAGLPLFGQALCREGYLWRRAFPGDYVCVTPDVRAQAASDNSQAKARLQPGSQYCLVPYVWREARPDDHVCVTVQTRTQTANDNAHAAERVATTPPRLATISPSPIRVATPTPLPARVTPPVQATTPGAPSQAAPPPVHVTTQAPASENASPGAHAAKTHRAEQHSSEQHSGEQRSEEKAPEQESFWSGIPGILTALGGFITAIATLVLAFKRQQPKAEAKAEEG